MRYYVRWGDRERVVEVRRSGDDVEVTVDGEPHLVDVAILEREGLTSLLWDRRSVTVSTRHEEGAVVLGFARGEVRVPIEDERQRAARLATAGAATAEDGPVEVCSVMPGVVREIRVEVGADVEAGAPLLILEAMKMENEIRAPRAGRVERIHVAAGQPVDKGARLVTIERRG